MEFRIADTFTAALGRLARDEQKAVKNSVFDLQTNPTMQGLQLHRIDASKDRNFWSVRVNSDIRIIVHKTAASLLLAYVDHHDDAYKWAARRRIEAHPKTGAVQIVEVRERVEEIARPRAYQENLDLPHPAELPLSQPAATKKKPEPQPFIALSRENLLSVGVPEDWVNDILVATEDQFLELATHLPGEASEALLEYVSSGSLKVPAPVVVADPFAHPDTFKHADTDPDEVLKDFSDDLNDHVLIGATMDFGTLTSTKPMEIQVFQLWYFAAHPEKAARPDFDAIMEAADRQFPGIASMDRKNKKRAGLRVLMAAMRDPELMDHPSTDRDVVRSMS